MFLEPCQLNDNPPKPQAISRAAAFAVTDLPHQEHGRGVGKKSLSCSALLHHHKAPFPPFLPDISITFINRNRLIPSSPHPGRLRWHIAHDVEHMKWCGSFKAAEPPPAATQTSRESIPPSPPRPVKSGEVEKIISREPRRHPHFLDTCQIFPSLAFLIYHRQANSSIRAGRRKRRRVLAASPKRVVGPAQRKRSGWAKARGDSTIDGAQSTTHQEPKG